VAIDSNLNVWVTGLETIDGELIAEGECFDGAFGFGDDDVRSYQGPVVLLFADGRKETTAEVTMFHLARRGLLWNLRIQNPPAAPFLVSSNLSLSGPVLVSLDIRPSAEARRILDSPSRRSHPVRTDGILGMLSGDASVANLVTFSTRNISSGDELELSFADWDLPLGVGVVLSVI